MLDHMKKLKMNEAAEAFAREAGITDSGSGYKIPDGFLSDWWCVFWDYYKFRVYGISNDGAATAESSAQAQAEAQALALDHAQAQAQAQAEIQTQAQAWALANNEMPFYDPFDYTMGLGQASVQQLPLYAYDANMMSQHGFLPNYVNANVQQGSAFPEHSSNPRHNSHNTAKTSRRSRRKVNRAGNQTGSGTASNHASTNPTTSGLPTPDPLGLNAGFEQINMRMLTCRIKHHGEDIYYSSDGIFGIIAIYSFIFTGGTL